MELNDIIRRIVDNKISELHTCLPARIEKYDPQKLRAEITLLNKAELEGGEVIIPPIIEVPVRVLKAGPFLIRPPYEKGDVVLVIFSERALDKLLITGEPESVQLTRKHALDDALVLGGLRAEQADKAPEEYSKDLIAGMTDGEEWFSYLTFTQEGPVILELDQDRRLRIEDSKITLQFDGMGEIEINAQQQTNIKGEDEVNSEAVQSDQNISAGINVNISAGITVNINAASDVNIDAGGNVNLQGGGPGIARLGDEIQLVIPSGSSAGTYVGTIISASEKAFSG